MNIRLANGQNVKMTMAEYVATLKQGLFKPEQIEPIALYSYKGMLVSADHRRLVAARLAGVPVRYRLATPKEMARATREKFDLDSSLFRIEIRNH
jgi:hypothetical protein